MIGWVGDDMSSLHLALYADADADFEDALNR